MSLRIFIAVIPFLMIHSSWAQLSHQERNLKNNKIKKVFTYTLSDTLATKQLSSIGYLNDSGQTIRYIILREGKDTSSVSVYKYDSLNRMLSERTEYEGKIYETNYLYPKPGIRIILDKDGDRRNAKTIKYKLRGRREIQYEYSGDKLMRKVKFIKKRYGYKTVYKSISPKGRWHPDTKGKEFCNADQNMIRAVVIYYAKHHTKYITTYEYNSLKLRTKLIQHPVPDYHKGNYHQLGRNYSCTLYEYFN